MDIPNVNQLSQQPGGGLVAGMNGVNAMLNNMYDAKINAIKAKYAPQTMQADVASKLAYANLMGPQFLAKLMGNEDILANMTPEQRTRALQMVYQAGSGQGPQGSQNALLANMQNPMQVKAPEAMTPLGQMVNSVKNAFGFNTPAQQNAANALLNQPNLSSQDVNAINNMQPGEAYTVQGNQAPIQQGAFPQAMKSDEAALSPYAAANLPQNANQNTFAENVGAYGGIKEEGKEAGKIRAKEINDLSDTVFQGQTKQATLDEASKIIASPQFEQMRSTPILGHNELAYYARYGTPEQKNMVGQLQTLSGNIIRDASQDFKGAFRKGEQQLLENMKINPGDTVDAAKGKLMQLSYLNKMITERAQLTANYMEQGHLSKLKAEQLADKQIKGDEIRASIYNQLNPKPTEDDIKFMANKYNMKPDEIRKRLKAKGLL